MAPPDARYPRPPSTPPTDPDRLARLLAAVRLGIWEWDVARDTVEWSEHVDDLFGLPPGAFARTYEAFLALVHPDDRAAITSAIEGVLAGTVDDYTIEHRIVWPDGSIHWLECKGLATRDETGRAVRIGGSVFDITARKHTEAALRDSEELLRQTAENLHEVVWLWACGEKRFLYVSPPFECVFGMPRRRVFERPGAWLDAVHPEDRAAVKAMLREQPMNHTLQYRLLGADGTVRWLRSRRFPIRDAAGALYRIAGIAEDITERRRIEEHFLHAQKIEAFGQLAGGVAHDFNNLLAVIVPHVQLASRVPGLDPRVRESLSAIGEAAQRAADLTRQLLQLGRREVLQPRDVELNQAVTSFGAMLRRVLREDVRLELRLCPSPLPVSVDPNMLDQVMMNLALNARDAMPQGGTLALETSEVTLAEDDASAPPGVLPGRYACLQVTDTGHGIPAEDLPRLFEPFFTTKQPGEGTGLGLATVLGIVQQHRGTITVASRLAEGATFRVLLPERAEDASPEPSVHARSAARGGDETILMVEDDPAVRTATALALQHHGYRVLAAIDGADALRILDERGAEIALVITDLVMPGPVSGRELVAQIKTRRPRTKLVLTSGYSPEVFGHELHLREGENFVPKPVPVERLLEIVRRSLDVA